MAAILTLGSSARALDHLQELPRLAPRERTARADLHRIAFLRLAVLVVREQLRRAADELAVRVVTDQALDLDGDGLLHLRADHSAGERARARHFGYRRLLGCRRCRGFCRALRRRGRGFRRSLLCFRFRRGLRGRLGFCCAHFFTPATAFSCASRAIVFNRAMVFRTLPNWSGFGAWPVARCRRRENCSLRSFMSSSVSSSKLLARSFASSSCRSTLLPVELDLLDFVVAFFLRAAISAPAVSRRRWTRRASSRRDERPRAPSLHPRRPSRRAPCRASPSRPSTRRCPCPRPYALRAASC